MTHPQPQPAAGDEPLRRDITAVASTSADYPGVPRPAAADAPLLMSGCTQSISDQPTVKVQVPAPKSPLGGVFRLACTTPGSLTLRVDPATRTEAAYSPILLIPRRWRPGAATAVGGGRFAVLRIALAAAAHGRV